MLLKKIVVKLIKLCYKIVMAIFSLARKRFSSYATVHRLDVYDERTMSSLPYIKFSCRGSSMRRSAPEDSSAYSRPQDKYRDSKYPKKSSDCCKEECEPGSSLLIRTNECLIKECESDGLTNCTNVSGSNEEYIRESDCISDQVKEEREQESSLLILNCQQTNECLKEREFGGPTNCTSHVPVSNQEYAIPDSDCFHHQDKKQCCESESASMTKEYLNKEQRGELIECTSEVPTTNLRERDCTVLCDNHMKRESKEYPDTDHFQQKYNTESSGLEVLAEEDSNAKLTNDLHRASFEDCCDLPSLDTSIVSSREAKEQLVIEEPHDAWSLKDTCEDLCASRENLVVSKQEQEEEESEDCRYMECAEDLSKNNKAYTSHQDSTYNSQFSDLLSLFAVNRVLLIARLAATTIIGCFLIVSSSSYSMTHMFVYSPFRLVFGTLYPAYASYKAVRTKNVKEYVSMPFIYSLLILAYIYLQTLV